MASGTYTGSEVSAACMHSLEATADPWWLAEKICAASFEMSSLTATAVSVLMLNYPPCRKELDAWMIPVLADICCEVSAAHSDASKSVQTSDAKCH